MKERVCRGRRSVKKKGFFKKTKGTKKKLKKSLVLRTVVQYKGIYYTVLEYKRIYYRTLVHSSRISAFKS